MQTASDSKSMATNLKKQLDNFEKESTAMHTEKKNALQELNDTFQELKGQVERSNMERDVEIDLRLKT